MVFTMVRFVAFKNIQNKMKQMFSEDVQVHFSKNNTLNHKSMFKAIWLMRTSQETPIIHSNEYGNELPL